VISSNGRLTITGHPNLRAKKQVLELEPSFLTTRESSVSFRLDSLFNFGVLDLSSASSFLPAEPVHQVSSPIPVRKTAELRETGHRWLDAGSGSCIR
jgi:hypothetical protein